MKENEKEKLVRSLQTILRHSHVHVAAAAATSTMLKTESLYKLLLNSGCSTKVKNESLQHHLQQQHQHQLGSGVVVEPQVTLEDRDLWNRFQALTNEMIVTKTGR